MIRLAIRAVVVALLTGAAASAAADLEIQVGRQTRRVQSRSHEGRPYYRLADIGRILDLRLQQRGSTVRASGPRGTLELTEGRPLARFQDQYIQLDLPVWPRSDGDWFVSEDFLTKVAPLLIEDRLEKTGNGRYRLGDLRSAEVRVEAVNYPDHVSIVFLATPRVSARVREFERHLKIEFDEVLVRPQLPATVPDPRFVAGLRFDPGSAYGGFEIAKGPFYSSFREYRLSDPDRLVVGLYGPPISTDGSRLPDTVSGPSAPDAPPDPPDELAPEYSPSRQRNIITIDAGHGGENYGVHPSQQLLEKNFALRLASKLEEKLKETRYRPALTRSRDLNLSPALRSAFGNQNRSRAFVSLHFGGTLREDVGGPVVYVHRYMSEPVGGGKLVPWSEGQRRYLDQSRRMADLLQGELNRLFGSQNRVAEAPLTVLEPVAAPAVLIEAGFLTNPDDLSRLQDPDFQDKLAAALTQALMDFLK